MNLNFSSKNIKNSLNKRVKGIFSGVEKTVKKTRRFRRNTRAFIIKNRRKRLRRKKLEAEEKRLENKKNIKKKTLTSSIKDGSINIIKAITSLFAGWLIFNLPKIIESTKKIIKDIKEIISTVKNAVNFLSDNLGEIIKRLVVSSTVLSKFNLKGAKSKITVSSNTLSNNFKNIKKLSDGKIKLLEDTMSKQTNTLDSKLNNKNKGKKNINNKDKKTNTKNKKINTNKLLDDQKFKAPDIKSKPKVKFNLGNRLKNLFSLRSIKSIKPSQVVSGFKNLGIGFVVDYGLNEAADFLINDPLNRQYDKIREGKVEAAMNEIGSKKYIENLENSLALELKKKPYPWWKNALTLGYGDIFDTKYRDKIKLELLQRNLKTAKDKEIIIINKQTNNQQQTSQNNIAEFTIIKNNNKKQQIEDLQLLKIGQ